ncbi:MAG: AlbA family DNA-binding domain-containing protein [Mycobacteriales bacterium]
MRSHEFAELVTDLRALGADNADVEAKRAEHGLPSSVRATLSAFANTRGGVLVLGLDEASGFTATGVPDPAKITSDLAACCSAEGARRPEKNGQAASSSSVSAQQWGSFASSMVSLNGSTTSSSGQRKERAGSHVPSLWPPR